MMAARQLTTTSAMTFNERVYRGAQWSEVIHLRQLSQPVIEAVKRLLTVRELPHSWDSYESPPPSELAIGVAIRLLIGVDLDEFPSPRIVPISGGGVQLEWDVGSRELELEILSDGTIRYLKVEEGEPTEESEIGPSHFARLASLLSWLISETS
ncbi:MAG: hypothetical protein HY695_34205 [Deltaproteobacteria bacterium]|nr:hypothetical protein [Deltaproteobacteria bacterium]